MPIDVTVRDSSGEISYQGPTVFLPQDQGFLSFGVIKAASARPQVALEGLFYPTYLMLDGDPINVMGDDRNPTLSMLLYSGDLGLDDGVGQSFYVLDKSKADPVLKADGSPVRVDLQPGQTETLPEGLGTVTFDGVEPWTRIQISRTPGKEVALLGVVLALIGLLGSLFIRPRRVWVRVRRLAPGERLPGEGGADEGEAGGAEAAGSGGTMVEVAVLSRSNAGTDTEGETELDRVVAALGGPGRTTREETSS